MRRVPGVGIDIGRDAEGGGARRRHIRAGRARARATSLKSKVAIIVAQIAAPGLGRGRQRPRSSLPSAPTRSSRAGAGGRVVGVELDHRELGLLPAHSRAANGRSPARAPSPATLLGADRPFDDAAGLARRQQAAQHEPAVLRLVAAVEQVDRRPSSARDRHAARRVLGREDQACCPTRSAAARRRARRRARSPRCARRPRPCRRPDKAGRCRPCRPP